MAQQHAENLQPQESPRARERREALDDVVAEVAVDARVDPEGYARDTLVPEGGE